MKKQATDWLELMKPWRTLLSSDTTYAVAPQGKWALSKDRLANLAMWNILGVASWAVPLTVGASLISNLGWKNKLKAKIKSAEETKLNSLRPVLSVDQDLTDTAEVKQRENKELNEISKYANESGTLPASGKSKDYNVVREGLYRSLPLIATPLLLWLASSGTHEVVSSQIGKELEDEQNKLNNLQDAVDTDILEMRGLIKKNKPGKNADSGAIVKTADSGIVDRLAQTAKGVYVDTPITSWLTLAALTAIGGGYYLHQQNEDVKTAKLLYKKLVGENRMMDTPELSIAIPRSFGTTDKKQLQYIPGISQGDSETRALPDKQYGDVSEKYVPTKDALFN